MRKNVAGHRGSLRPSVEGLEIRALMAGTIFQPVAPNLPQRVSVAITNLLNRSAFPGVSVALVVNGSGAVVQGYGLANIARKTPVSSTTPFEVASVSKTMIAFAFLQLYQESLGTQNPINLDAPFETYMPSIPTPTGAFTLPASWSTITTRELLNMTSGIHDDASRAPWYSQIETVAKDRLLFTPGSEVSYSDPSFYLLGALIEKLSGLQLDAYMTSNVFEPLGMSNTELLGAQNMVAGQATGYGILNQTTKTFPRATIYNGPAVFTDGVVSTAADMSKYIVALLNEELLDPSTYALMWMPAHVPGLQFRGSVSNRGLGWDTVELNQSGDVTRIGKTGEAFGYMAQLYVYNQAKAGVFVAFNGDGGISAPAVADAVYASTSTAAIQGTVVNGEGAPVRGATVYIDANSNGRLDPGEERKVTGEAGRFTFDDVTPGDVAVSVVIRKGWRASQPGTAQAFYALSAGSVATPAFSISR